MLPKYEDILHLVAYNGYAMEAYLGSMACKATWNDERIIVPHVLNMKFGSDEETLIGIYARKCWCKDNIPYLIERAKYLLKLGANSNIPDKKGSTPFKTFCIYGNYMDSGLEMLKILLAANIDIDKGSNYWNPLSLIASRNEFILTELFLEKGANPNYIIDSSSVLSLACEYNKSKGKETKSIDLLLKHGADPNFIDQWGNSILQTCLLKGYITYVDLLIQYGAVLPDEHWIMSEIIHKNNECAIKIPQKYGCIIPSEAMYEKIENSDTNGIAILLRNGISPNTISEDNGHPLEHALNRINTQTIDIVKLLCKAGADVNNFDEFDESYIEKLFKKYIANKDPLVLEIIETLISFGAKLPSQKKYHEILDGKDIKNFIPLK